MGFEENRFISQVEDRYKCDHCQNVLENPVCTPCGRFYCSGCALPCVLQSGKCPSQCCADLSPQDLDSPSELQEVILEMKVTCDFSDRGCQNILRLADYEAHVRDCQFQPVQCSNKGCFSLVCKKDLANHQISMCDWRPEGVCPRGCGLTVVHKDAQTHVCMDALKARVSEQQQTIEAYEYEVRNLAETLRGRERTLVTEICRLQKALQIQTTYFQRKVQHYQEKLSALSKQACHSEHPQEEEHIMVILERENGTLGFSIIGGYSPDSSPTENAGVCVSRIDENTPADKTGMLIQDRILKVNGQDLSSASHEEAVEAFCAAKEPIVVEVLRRVGKGSSRMKAQPPAMVSVATQTDKAIEGPFFSLFHPPPPPPPEETCCFNPAGSLWQPASRHPVAFPNSDLGLTDIEMTNGMDYDDMYEDERQIDVEYEEVTLHRSSSEEKVGLTLYYGSPDDDVTDIYISEIEPCSIAACDGRIREGDQILQINGIDVHSREQAIRLFSESRSNITLLLARQVQTDDGFLEDQSMLLEGDLHHNLLVHPRHHPSLPVHHRLQVHDEEGGTTDTATTENSHKHEKDSGVGRTDESTRNDESSEQEINEGECGSPASNPRSHGASSLGVGDHHYSNDSFTSSEMQEAGELPAEDLSQTQCDKFRQVLEHRCANVEARYPPKMTRKDSQSSIDREIAMLNKEMEEIQMECQEIVEMHTRHQHKGHGNDPRLDIFRSPRMVPRMGTKLDYAKQILAAHDGPDAVWLRHEQKLQGWQEKKEADGRGSMSAPVTPAREPERDKDTSNTSAYNTGDSCRSTPAPLTLELSQAADTVADKNQGSMLSLTIPVQKPSHSDSEKMAADQGFGVRECSSDGDGIKPGELKKSHSSNSVSRMSQTPNGDITEAQVDSLQDIYAQYADVMYTNRENLEHTMMVQQKLFQQKLAGRQQNGKDGNSVSPTATEAGTGQQGAVAVGSDASTTQMEWVVKRRADGTRYITRRPVRNKILKERAKKLAEERAGMTTDDDAVSELKTGRYWSKEDRKRHLERARDHKRRKEFMMKARMETLKEGDEQKKEPNIVELSHRKMMKHKGKKVFDNFTTVQEMLAHGSRLPEGSKTYNPLLSVTTV